MRQQGVVLQFNVSRGYGFIKTPAAQSLFFHIKQVREGYLLEPGDTVVFTIGPSAQQAGKYECYDVELVTRAAKAVQS
jgi:cold shock CspA family protein